MKKSLLTAAILIPVLFSGISVHTAAGMEQGINSEAEANGIWETALSYAKSGIPAFEERQKELAGMLGKDDGMIRFTDARIENLVLQKQEEGIAFSGVLYCERNPVPDQEAFQLTWKN